MGRCDGTQCCVELALCFPANPKPCKTALMVCNCATILLGLVLLAMGVAASSLPQLTEHQPHGGEPRFYMVAGVVSVIGAVKIFLSLLGIITAVLQKSFLLIMNLLFVMVMCLTDIAMAAWCHQTVLNGIFGEYDGKEDCKMCLEIEGLARNMLSPPIAFFSLALVIQVASLYCTFRLVQYYNIHWSRYITPPPHRSTVKADYVRSTSQQPPLKSLFRLSSQQQIHRSFYDDDNNDYDEDRPDDVFSQRDHAEFRRHSMPSLRERTQSLPGTLYRNRQSRSEQTLNRSHPSLNRSRQSLNRSRQSLNRSRETLSGSRDTLNRSRECVRVSVDARNSAVDVRSWPSEARLDVLEAISTPDLRMREAPKTPASKRSRSLRASTKSRQHYSLSSTMPLQTYEDSPGVRLRTFRSFRQFALATQLKQKELNAAEKGKGQSKDTALKAKSPVTIDVSVYENQQSFTSGGDQHSSLHGTTFAEFPSSILDSRYVTGMSFSSMPMSTLRRDDGEKEKEDDTTGNTTDMLQQPSQSYMETIINSPLPYPKEDAFRRTEGSFNTTRVHGETAGLPEDSIYHSRLQEDSIFDRNKEDSLHALKMRDDSLYISRYRDESIHGNSRLRELSYTKRPTSHYHNSSLWESRLSHSLGSSMSHTGLDTPGHRSLPIDPSPTTERPQSMPGRLNSLEASVTQTTPREGSPSARSRRPMSAGAGGSFSSSVHTPDTSVPGGLSAADDVFLSSQKSGKPPRSQPRSGHKKVINKLSKMLTPGMSRKHLGVVEVTMTTKQQQAGGDPVDGRTASSLKKNESISKEMLQTISTGSYWRENTPDLSLSCFDTSSEPSGGSSSGGQTSGGGLGGSTVVGDLSRSDHLRHSTWLNPALARRVSINSTTGPQMSLQDLPASTETLLGNSEETLNGVLIDHNNNRSSYTPQTEWKHHNQSQIAAEKEQNSGYQPKGFENCANTPHYDNNIRRSSTNSVTENMSRGSTINTSYHVTTNYSSIQPPPRDDDNHDIIINSRREHDTTGDDVSITTTNSTSISMHSEASSTSHHFNDSLDLKFDYDNVLESCMQQMRYLAEHLEDEERDYEEFAIDVPAGAGGSKRRLPRPASVTSQMTQSSVDSGASRTDGRGTTSLDGSHFSAESMII